MRRTRPSRLDGECPTSVKVELVLRLLGGESPERLARETGRPPKQLTAWRRRFLAAGEAQLDGRFDRRELETLRDERRRLADAVARLEAENHALARRVALLGRGRAHAHADADAVHPYCTERYARALETSDVRPLRVPEWGTHVLVRERPGGAPQASGIRPIASLDPACDVRAGLDTLREAGIASVSLTTDPMWSPELPALQDAFDSCRPFKEYYLVDREGGEVHIRKRHRNRINQARRAGEVREVSFADHLDRWLELYGQNVAEREIAQPFSAAFFERLARLDGLRTIAVVADGEIVTLTVWIRHADILYFHNGASSARGFAISASYAAFAHAIEQVTDCRYLFLGGSSDFRDERLDGLAVFKRGFSNAMAVSYLCSAGLRRAAPASRPGEATAVPVAPSAVEGGAA